MDSGEDSFLRLSDEELERAVDEAHARADALPLGEERLELRRNIWRMVQELHRRDERREAEERERRERELEEERRQRKERRRKELARRKGIVIRTEQPIASQDYECYGCGECPIPKGERYLKATVVQGGKIHTFRYCQRCHCALDDKVRASPSGIEIQGPNSLTWRRLGSHFRRRWTELCERLREAEGDHERQRELTRDFLKHNGERK